jgi:NAD(P)-dependent dehydrogenase (short-subunit alcohol dehydrogenase family)
MKGKVALVTGAAQGIGKQTTLALAEHGTNIVLCDLKPMANLADLLRAKGVHVLELQGDISEEGEVKRFATQVRQEFGGLDILVNNGNSPGQP